jgi:hypothetical protein
MTHPSPPACSLTAAEGAQRAARWRRLLDQHLLSRTATTYGQRLAFPSEAPIARDLDALIAAERDCCPFLTLTLERFDDALILDVSAPPDAAPIVETMFGAAA